MSSAKEHPFTSLDDIGPMLNWLAKRRNLTLNGLVVHAGGATHSGLVSFATGARPVTDLLLGPLLKVVTAVGYEVGVRPRSGAGIKLVREGAEPLLVMGADGGPIDLSITTLDDVRVVINTIAVAKGMAVSGLIKSTVNASSLVSFATGRNPRAEIQAKNVLALMEQAGFRASVRPVHPSAREARILLARNS